MIYHTLLFSKKPRGQRTKKIWPLDLQCHIGWNKLENEPTCCRCENENWTSRAILASALRCFPPSLLRFPCTLSCLSLAISICCLLISIHEFYIFAFELSDPFLCYKMQLGLWILLKEPKLVLPSVFFFSSACSKMFVLMCCSGSSLWN